MTRLDLRILSILGLLILGGSIQADEEASLDFLRDIRPILSDKCFACHGPDEHTRKGGLRLDHKEGALGKADSEETIVVPGDPATSLLISRITSTNGDDHMPPAEATKQLSPQEIELLTKWVQGGAAWQEHWAYIAPTKPAVPQTQQPEGMINEIDAFVRRRLDLKNLRHASPADKSTLIRRVTLDLTGLPPAPEEVDAFLADESPEAYEKLVDRLLGSPRFGEHMARFWLDAARYGDTHGLHLDNYREMWPYRDWVIQAYNRNLPYDQFLTEQLAGDLLENATQDQRIASGFNRCHVTTSEGGSIAEEVYTRNVVDRVVTTSTVMMGTTFECSRCHDHKFDPFTMKDFYGLFAYFNSLDQNPLDGNAKAHPPVIQVPFPDQAEKLAAFDKELADLRTRLNGEWPAVDQAQQTWLTDIQARLTAQGSEPDAQWQVAKPEVFTSSGGATLELQEDGSVLASGTNPNTEIYESIIPLTEGGWQAVRLEGMVHPSLSAGGHGRSANSNVVLTEFELYVASADKPEEWQRVNILRAWADHEQGNGDFKVANAIDGQPKSGWATEGFAKKEDRKAYFLADRLFGAEGSKLKIVQKYESQYGQHQFGRVRLSLTRIDPLPLNLPKEIEDIAKLAADQVNDAQRTKLRDHYRQNVTTNEEYVAVRNQTNAKQKERDDLNGQIPTTLVSAELPEAKKAYMLKRGEYDQLGDEVQRAVPTVLPPMKPEWPNNRLGLAYWLTDPSHPLTARVQVNRMWQQLFGTGIVKTAEDFGSQGEPPSHPMLLDWLSVTFREEGWDMKRMLKRMVMSATYRQSSAVTPEVLEADPRNRMLAHGPRFRLDAEMLRDQALFVSGMLVEKQGGPGVRPPQPAGLWEAVGYVGSNTVRFVADTGADKVHRRTLYTFLKRTSPPPQMTTFDGPSREACIVRRERTNTPLQALLLFNDPQYVEAARALAQRSLAAEGDDSAKLRSMFRLAVCRNPDPAELEVLQTGVSADLAHYQANAEAAAELLKVGEFPLPAEYDAAKLAAWTMTANLLLNLDEVVTKN